MRLPLLLLLWLPTTNPGIYPSIVVVAAAAAPCPALLCPVHRRTTFFAAYRISWWTYTAAICKKITFLLV